MTAQQPLPLLVEGLSATYVVDGERSEVVSDVNLRLAAGSVLGLAGESGCGKSTLALAMIGFPVPDLEITGNSLYRGINLLDLTLAERRKLWGRRIAYVPQSLAGSLNPSLPVGRQLLDPTVQHLGLSRAAARERVAEILDLVQLPYDRQSLRRRPGGFSGGQRQRLALAAVLVCRPDVIVLDEPTTGLDVTTQVSISRLIRDYITRSGASAVYISHDIGLLSSISDELCVMYAGELVERSRTRTVLDGPLHPYTRALVRAVPSLHDQLPPPGIAGVAPTRAVNGHGCFFANRCPHADIACADPVPLRMVEDTEVRCVRAVELAPERPRVHHQQLRFGATLEPVEPEPLFSARSVHRTYRTASRKVEVLKELDLAVDAGEFVALVGESGSGKSTFLKMAVGLDPDGLGSFTYRGEPLARHARSRTRRERAAIQLVPQDFESSLNPRQRVGKALSRAVELFRPDLVTRASRAEEVDLLMRSVGLDPGLRHRFPHELSGGQKQRVSIARALSGQPELLVCDEITSALDVSVQAAVIGLLVSLCKERRMSILFVTHNLALLRPIADRVVVLEKGVVVEEGTADELFSRPRTPYVRSLLSSARGLDIDQGLLPQPTAPSYTASELA